MATTVDGLVSGLDTTTIISQLMTLQAAPQTRLKTSLSAQQSAVSSLQSVNTRFATLRSAAEALQKATTWGAASASSSSSSVSVTAASGALAGSTSFSVTQLASAQSSVSSTTYGSLKDTGSFSDTTFELHRGTGADAKTVTITPSNGSLESLVNAINGTSDAGVRAAAVQVSPGQYRLQLTATDTGAKNAFSLTGAGGAPLTGLSFGQVSAAQDAVLHVGDANAGFDITSASNTVEGVMPGVTVKVTAKASDVTLTVGRDPGSIATAIQSLVDAANGVLSTIGTVSTNGTAAADGTRTGAGALAGDSLMRQLTSQLLSKITGGIGGKSLSAVGLAVSKSGTITFDQAKFTDTFSKDPVGAQADVQHRHGGRHRHRRQARRVRPDQRQQHRHGRRRDLRPAAHHHRPHNRISDWDVTLAARKEALEKQYSALETALGKLKNQSTWLAGQINQLSQRELLVTFPMPSRCRRLPARGRPLRRRRHRDRLAGQAASSCCTTGCPSTSPARTRRSWTATARPPTTNIAHAQDIVAELLSSLDTDAWDGAANLASLYRWLLARADRGQRPDGRHPHRRLPRRRRAAARGVDRRP